MEASFLLRLGQIELQCSGSEAFLSAQLPQFLTYIAQNRSAAETPTQGAGASSGTNQVSAGVKSVSALSVSSVAAKLASKSGPDLIIAACLRLTRDGQKTFSRQQILDEMKAASSYYRTSYMSNLTKYLSTLIQGGKLLEQAKDQYALEATNLNELESKLA
jgi:hypothetical protein